MIFLISKMNRGRDKSRFGLRNWREKRTIRFLFCSFFFEISEKPDFWTFVYLREAVTEVFNSEK